MHPAFDGILAGLKFVGKRQPTPSSPKAGRNKKNRHAHNNTAKTTIIMNDQGAMGCNYDFFPPHTFGNKTHHQLSLKYVCAVHSLKFFSFWIWKGRFFFFAQNTRLQILGFFDMKNLRLQKGPKLPAFEKIFWGGGTFYPKPVHVLITDVNQHSHEFLSLFIHLQSEKPLIFLIQKSPTFVFFCFAPKTSLLLWNPLSTIDSAEDHYFPNLRCHFFKRNFHTPPCKTPSLSCVVMLNMTEDLSCLCVSSAACFEK